MKFFHLMLVPLLFVLSFQANAAGSKNNRYADNLPELPKVARILVLPLYDNNHLQGGESTDLVKELKTQLEKLGHKIDAPTFEQLAGADFAATIEQNYALLQSEFIPLTQKKADAKAEFAKIIDYVGDIIVMPSITLRPAVLKGEMASWDNDGHKLRVIGTMSEMSWSGQIQGLSLTLDVFSNKGEWLFTSYGGVSLPVVADVPERKYVRKENLFEHKKDIKKMQSGITRAIYPIRKRLKI